MRRAHFPITLSLKLGCQLNKIAIIIGFYCFFSVPAFSICEKVFSGNLERSQGKIQKAYHNVSFLDAQYAELREKFSEIDFSGIENDVFKKIKKPYTYEGYNHYSHIATHFVPFLLKKLGKERFRDFLAYVRQQNREPSLDEHTWGIYERQGGLKQLNQLGFDGLTDVFGTVYTPHEHPKLTTAQGNYPPSDHALYMAQSMFLFFKNVSVVRDCAARITVEQMMFLHERVKAFEELFTLYKKNIPQKNDGSYGTVLEIGPGIQGGVSILLFAHKNNIELTLIDTNPYVATTLEYFRQSIGNEKSRVFGQPIEQLGINERQSYIVMDAVLHDLDEHTVEITVKNALDLLDSKGVLEIGEDISKNHGLSVITLEHIIQAIVVKDSSLQSDTIYEKSQFRIKITRR